MIGVRLRVAAVLAAAAAGATIGCDNCEACAPDPLCSYRLSLEGFGMIATGGNLAELVFAPSGCKWAFRGDVDWVSVEPGTEGEPNGDGNGTVVIMVAPNTGPRRVGTATIAFQKVQIDQAGTDGAGPCTFSVIPVNAAFGAAGGRGGVAVLASAADCGWYADKGSSAEDWVVGFSTPARRAGSGFIPYTVNAAGGAGPPLPRVGEIFIRNSANAIAATHTISQ